MFFFKDPKHIFLHFLYHHIDFTHVQKIGMVFDSEVNKYPAELAPSKAENWEEMVEPGWPETWWPRWAWAETPPGWYPAAAAAAAAAAELLSAVLKPWTWLLLLAVRWDGVPLFPPVALLLVRLDHLGEWSWSCSETMKGKNRVQCFKYKQTF